MASASSLCRPGITVHHPTLKNYKPLEEKTVNGTVRLAESKRSKVIGIVTHLMVHGITSQWNYRMRTYQGIDRTSPVKEIKLSCFEASDTKGIEKIKKCGAHKTGFKDWYKNDHQKGMSLCCMKQLAVLLVLTLTFIYLNMRGPNKRSNLKI